VYKQFFYTVGIEISYHCTSCEEEKDSKAALKVAMKRAVAIPTRSPEGKIIRGKKTKMTEEEAKRQEANSYRWWQQYGFEPWARAMQHSCQICSNTMMDWVKNADEGDLQLTRKVVCNILKICTTCIKVVVPPESSPQAADLAEKQDAVVDEKGKASPADEKPGLTIEDRESSSALPTFSDDKAGEESSGSSAGE